jgi:hypothetical protein
MQIIVYNPKESRDYARCETRVGKPGSTLRAMSYALWYAREMKKKEEDRRSAFRDK